MSYKVLTPYKPGQSPIQEDAFSDIKDADKFCFNDLIQHQWFGSKLFQVFINLKHEEESEDAFQSADEVKEKRLSVQSSIVEIQISKSTFNGKMVKLILVRSIDYLIKNWVKSTGFKDHR